ncbi:PREDICTED: uncharacterized protein LOC105315583 [Amphimedon queenslandica]|uniref:Death domain-containing protein n=1 Tax=Amphimedon queenslandica TaxID=400682 RepID=A0AAN0IRP0_AMPQE|nr:PREDICTED: uncharacterized protein LOC105315583 [Amphimedon queenslandica]|eukprot:XP_011408586.1 PREDICTED: uncharacterized protein LOC105315583 [Amphimedon queenslandica]
MDTDLDNLALTSTEIEMSIGKEIEAENVKIDEQKSALYSKWLSVNPKATWRDVINALTSRNQNKLAQDIKVAMERNVVSKESSRRTSSFDDVEIIFFPKDDQIVQDSLDELQAKFSHIMRNVKSAFNYKTVRNSQLSFDISNWIESYLHWEHGTAGSDLDDIFKKIYHNYDFIDCSLIVAMCNEFISDEKDLLDELKVYSLNANAFRSSRPITELKQKLRKVYGPYRRQLENMPLICIELQNPWNDVKINGLYILIGRLLPKELRQSIMKCITIEPGSVVIKLHILDFTADSLIEYRSTKGKLQFMRLIAELLLKEQVDPNIQEEDGWNALMLACQNGHIQIAKLLLKEQVDPNIQEEDGWNAFMLACENGHIQIGELLLKEQVDPNIQDRVGHTALMAASSNGHYEVVKLLLEWEADPTIKSNEGHTALSLSKDSEIKTLIYNYMYKKDDVV